MRTKPTLHDHLILYPQVAQSTSALGFRAAGASYRLTLAHHNTTLHFAVEDGGVARIRLNSKACPWASNVPDMIAHLQRRRENGQSPLYIFTSHHITSHHI